MIDLVTTAVRNVLKVTHYPGLKAERFQPGVLANDKSRFIRQQLPGLDGFFWASFTAEYQGKSFTAGY